MRSRLSLTFSCGLVAFVGCASAGVTNVAGPSPAMPSGFEHAHYAATGPTIALAAPGGCELWLGVDELVLAKADAPLMHLPPVLPMSLSAAAMARPQLRAELVKSCAADAAVQIHVDGRVTMLGLAQLAYSLSLEKKRPLIVVDVPSSGLRVLHPTEGGDTPEEQIILVVAASPGDEAIVKSTDGRECPADSPGELTVCTQRLVEALPKGKIPCAFLAVTPESTTFQHMLDVAYAIRADSGGGACTSTALQITLGS